ncbi:unnamed protein product [Didymodactylos carnosus]|uniref:Uncharacterized protein n=1 Tax=Didymodactylos carnosus TaxID=1234261 RepID=A0A813Q5T5_9BILA|nr:unnamed protein product [Didymodactylos carnosus]CAF1632686.1 unnamed protein product [Didymodactylos carnosus]CAF3543528.1 unnamed protein product [Didymodactylos carnosus]CAF4460488.1 unnamed protein product [Didymodactylos carnosus]
MLSPIGETSDDFSPRRIVFWRNDTDSSFSMDRHSMNIIKIAVKFVSDELRDNGSIIDIDEIKRKLIQDLINNYDESLFGSNVQ